MSSHPIKILAIIPCYNEAFAISSLLEEFRQLDFPCDTLVVDDGSGDDSSGIAARLATHVIRFGQNQGVPAAIHAGLRYARENNYDLCVQIDGDGQHVPAQIGRLLAAYEQSPASLTIGSRYYGKIFPPFRGGIRRMGGLAVSAALFVLFGRRWLYDSTSGMRMMDRQAIDYFEKHLNASFPDAVIVAQALHAGLSVREVRVNMRPRMHGTSYVSGWKGVWFLLRVLRDMVVIRCGTGKDAPQR